LAERYRFEYPDWRNRFGGYFVYLSLYFECVLVIRMDCGFGIFFTDDFLLFGMDRDAIESLAQKAGFHLANIFVMDGSKRSTKANAYFTGFWKKKRIVLFDTLMNDLTTEEIVAVLAHEIGHYKKKHVVYSLALSILTTGVIFYILSLFLGNLRLAEALGGEHASFHLGIIGFAFLFTPISELLGLIINRISRKNEYEADDFTSQFDIGEALISALKKISVQSLSNLNPHPLVVFWYYSHPTLLQRIGKMRQVGS